MKKRTTGRQLLARAQVGIARDLRVMYTQMLNEISLTLQRYGTGPDQTIPRSQHDDLLEEVGQIHRKYFLSGTTGRKSFDDKELALTPYAKILQKWYVHVVVGAVRLDRAWMKRSIPKDVYAWLARTYRNMLSDEQEPTQEALHRWNRWIEQREPVPVQEAENPYARRPDEDGDAYRARLIKDLHIVHDNPLAEIDVTRRWVPWLRWTDENGYRLSDRLWRGEQRAREKIDAILMRELRNNLGSLKLSRLLQLYLLPARKDVKTNKPYGTTASFDAMRLARTEISRAYNQAAYTSALINPYVNSIDVVRSANGDRNCKTCPQHATIDIGGKRIRPAYDQNAAHIPPFHPHDMCRIEPAPTDTPEQITQNIRALMEFDPTIAPAPSAATDLLINALLGPELAGLWRLNQL